MTKPPFRTSVTKRNPHTSGKVSTRKHSGSVTTLIQEGGNAAIGNDPANGRFIIPTGTTGVDTTVVTNNFRGRYIANRIADLRKNKTPEIDITAWVKSAEKFPFENIWVLFTFIGLMVISVFYSAAIARMMAKKYPVL
jgi:hypothetical protein